MKKQVFAKYIVADPKVCHDQLTFKGTRILVEDVLDHQLDADVSQILIRRRIPGVISHRKIEEIGRRHQIAVALDRAGERTAADRAAGDCVKSGDAEMIE